MNAIEKRFDDLAEPVHTLMRKQVRAFWERSVGGARASADNEELRGVEALNKSMAREWARKLALVANLKRRVHGPICNRIMPHAVIEARFPGQ